MAPGISFQTDPDLASARTTSGRGLLWSITRAVSGGADALVVGDFPPPHPARAMASRHTTTADRTRAGLRFSACTRPHYRWLKTRCVAHAVAIRPTAGSSSVGFRCDVACSCRSAGLRRNSAFGLFVSRSALQLVVGRLRWSRSAVAATAGLRSARSKTMHDDEEREAAGRRACRGSVGGRFIPTSVGPERGGLQPLVRPTFS